MQDSTTESVKSRAGKRNRNFPADTLSDALDLARAIKDQSAGKPMNRVLLADAIGKSPESSVFRILLSSANKYGLTEGSEKSLEISLAEIGQDATSEDSGQQLRALRRAALLPPVFDRFYRDFDQNKVPPPEMLRKTLVTKYDVPEEWAGECAEILIENGRTVGIIQDLSSGSRILLDSALAGSVGGSPAVGSDESDSEETDLPVEAGSFDPDEETTGNGHARAPSLTPESAARRSKVLFVGHGKNHGPVEKIERFLVKYGIPHKIAEDEPNLGRPIPTKVKDTMKTCGAAILIFTKDEEFFDREGNSIWRPSENVIYELGAASLLYEDRIVIFMEEGLHFPANFESVGHIAFDEDQIEAKTSELLQELIGLGLIKITVN